MPVILRVIEGPDAGTVVRLSAGETIVGKGTRASLKLSSPGVSLEHLAIRQADDGIYAENLSARGTLVNESKITGKVRLRLRDRIRVSDDTLLRLETEGGDTFVTQYRPVIMAVIILFLVAAMALFFYDPFTTPEPKADWARTHAALGRFIDRQIAAKKYPAVMHEYWDTAWRQEQAENYKASVPIWLELQEMIQNCESTQNLGASDAHAQRFRKLLRSSDPDKLLEDEHAGANVARFISERYHRDYNAAGRKEGMFE